MNPNYTEFKFPAIRAHPWSKVFSKRLPPDAVDLVRGPGLQNSGCTPMHRKRFPERRLPAISAMQRRCWLCRSVPGIPPQPASGIPTSLGARWLGFPPQGLQLLLVF